MTERKPGNVSWESWVEGQIRLSMEQGEFDDLPGKGKPIAGLEQPYDEMWWVREKLRRENFSFLPPALEVRRDLDEMRRVIAATYDEDQVREHIRRINDRIRYVNSHVVEGPPSTMMPLDEEEEVEQWRRHRPPAPPAPTTVADTPDAGPDAGAPSRPSLTTALVVVLVATIVLALVAGGVLRP